MEWNFLPWQGGRQAARGSRSQEALGSTIQFPERIMRKQHLSRELIDPEHDAR
jgi:hypothetical protein